MKLPVAWRPRSLPLTPVAVVAQSKTARTLALKLLTWEAEALARLKGISGRELLVVLGEETLLPWVDGVVYLGHAPEAPALLLPTLLEPSVSLPLLERALRRQAPDLQPPMAVLPPTQTLLSLAAARPIARETLLRWLENNA